ncbi:GAF and ANTAR domain-containing protein [Nocardioides sp. CPCC 205120]|uniref:GAF and ANTAR domain-containing protein n=1 Tax=Nocardioides sp. CPCC 205120 TaxID=3406462 RepID=UPI003B50C653
MASAEKFNRDLADMARGMQGERSTNGAMAVAVEAARDVITGCEIAAVSIVTRTGIETPVLTHPHARDIDEWQYELSEGPCLEALQNHEVVNSNDLATDARWPRWGPRVAADLGMRSMLSHRLFSSTDTLGALNLYGTAPSAFTTQDIHNVTALAAHIGVALASAQENAHLVVALDTRTIIGQASGMLVERFDLSPEQAFAVLARISQTQNMKLNAVAEHLVRTRKLPTPPDA